jgi:E3 ubiquitin-protein ligase HERC2
VLQRLNKALLVAIPYFDLCSMDTPGTLSHLLCSFRGLIFHCTKDRYWKEALDRTQTNSDKFTVNLSRSRAAKHAQTGVPDNEGKMMVFSQAFRQIHSLPPSRLRRSGQLYSTVFMGEHSNDYGGPYSESFAMMCLELQSLALPLFVRTRNGVWNTGQNKEKWVFNPAATSSLHLEMFSFLGKLMGIAIRSKEYLGLNIPSLIWKLLVRDTPTKSDLEAINISYTQSLDRIREYDQNTMTYMEQTFTLTTYGNREVELVPGGGQELVTFATRDQYCDLCERYYLHEYDEQAAAVRQGLGSIVPPHLLSLYSWQELDHMVCGDPVIDISLLQSVTTYQNCSASDEHIIHFWTVLEEFTEAEKSSFLRFTWGRSRLPLTKEGFSRKLKIEQFTPRGRATQDECLPVSHTCFFSLELPKYSTLEILRDKLTYAIYNCVAIDGAY